MNRVGSVIGTDMKMAESLLNTAAQVETKAVSLCKSLWKEIKREISALSLHDYLFSKWEISHSWNILLRESVWPWTALSNKVAFN